jgi:hypothetical protein
MGAGIGAILFTQTTGFVVDHFLHTPMLVVAGLLLVGTAVLFALGGAISALTQDCASAHQLAGSGGFSEETDPRPEGPGTARGS